MTVDNASVIESKCGKQTINITKKVCLSPYFFKEIHTG